MNDAKAKQQVVDKIKASTNILVTVSNSPSVDALSAALGLTLMLDKLGKHTTAIFSGSVPPAITFLNPDQTFEATVDSLRDFIIALDKEKADHLRYKIDGDVVKIFITPYKTTISDKDLEFSQGDYNVELILALGVDNQEHLDQALSAHGQILHDATVITVSAGDQVSQLGSIDWHDPQASSLSEMLASLTDVLKTEDDKNPLLDQQSSTALLTGIVAETARFSNTKTSSKAMNIAAQLMAAGADQQLIASKLQDTSTAASTPDSSSSANAYGVTGADGSISIDHKNETLEQLEDRVGSKDAVPAQPTEAVQPPVAPAVTPVETETPTIPAPTITDAYAVQPEDVPAPAAPTPPPATDVSTPQEATPSHKYATDEGNPVQDDTILKHSYLTDLPANTAPMNATNDAAADTASVDIFSGNSNTPPASVNDPTMPSSEPVSGVPPLTPEVAAALPQPPPLPDFSKLPPPTSLGGSDSGGSGLPPAQPEILGDILKDDKPAPPPVQPPQAPVPQDPGQFQIPGQ